ncbi:Rubredoxin-NAD(+) reductase [hydrothermal vent metagenome]|uniref:Rubredoxin-NAD(+) reductase n=1 Tax=hydrothermal vent metagenome TaxID=652676 RepID=A0A3B1AKZ9_9ZZZZ
MKPIVIIGSGISAYSVAREFRKINEKTPLHIISMDSADNYSKPMLSNALANSKNATNLVMAESAKMAEQLSAKISANTLVHAIDTEKQTVNLASEVIPYSKLVLALGAKPIRLSINGDAAEQVLAVNNLTDYAKFRKAIKGKKDIVILGPGLIGCEFANDLVQNKFNVTVVGPDKYPLERMLPQAAGRHLQSELENLGIKFKLETTVEAINFSESQLQLQLADEVFLLKADVVLSAIGLKSEVFLASEANIIVNKGIVVDKTLQTSAENVYALGDCAEVNGLVLPYIMPIMNSARALAQTLSGNITEVSYPAMPVVIKTPACPIAVASPANESDGEWQIDENDEGVKACFYQSENLTGFVLTGERVSEKQSLTKDLPAYF